MILTDVVNLQDVSWGETVADVEVNKGKVDVALNLKADYEAANRISKYMDYSDVKVLEKASETIKGKFNQTRMDLLLQNNCLPATLVSKDGSEDIISRVAQSPKTTLGHLRELSDKLGFILVPFEYLDKRSYEKESYQLQSSIDNFDKKLSQWFNIYVLSPIHFYDVQKHVESKADLPIYANKDAAQAFMAINMALPMFRTLAMNINQLRDKSNELAGVVNRTNQELTNLAKRVTALETQVEMQRQQAIMQEARNREIRAQLEQLQSRREVWAYEPLMFAVPKNKEITDESTVFLGPCWGPDFQDIVFAALDLKQIKDQRATMSKKALEWSTASGYNRDPRPIYTHIDGVPVDDYNEAQMRAVRNAGGKYFNSSGQVVEPYRPYRSGR